MKQLGIRSDAPRAKRWSLAVRLVSRGADWAVANSLILFGGWWWLHAAVIGGAINCLIDYLGHRYYAFTDRSEEPPRSLIVIVLFLGLRAVYMLPAVALLLLLYNGVGLPYLFSSAVVTVVMWKINFKDFEALFTGQSNEILKPLRERISRFRKKGANS